LSKKNYKNNNKEIEPISISDTTKTEQCKIISIRKNVIDINFKGYGISIDVNNFINYSIGDIIKIEYESDIGKPDFKILNKF
jgi:hypothetical protein